MCRINTECNRYRSHTHTGHIHIIHIPIANDLFVSTVVVCCLCAHLVVVPGIAMAHHWSACRKRQQRKQQWSDLHSPKRIWFTSFFLVLPGWYPIFFAKWQFPCHSNPELWPIPAIPTPTELNSYPKRNMSWNPVRLICFFCFFLYFQFIFTIGLFKRKSHPCSTTTYPNNRKIDVFSTKKIHGLKATGPAWCSCFRRQQVILAWKISWVNRPSVLLPWVCQKNRAMKWMVNL